mmetsp:Transcript_33849/g.99518  ORF Transcript_33849/g.99518 Transcript_33849/m.99518 type:complete len:90 (-) Transcript_33849:124-393(-)
MHSNGIPARGRRSGMTRSQLPISFGSLQAICVRRGGGDTGELIVRTFRGTEIDANRLHPHRLRSPRHRLKALDEIFPLDRKRTDGWGLR